MTSETFERLRVPVALLLLALAVAVFWPRGTDAGSSGPAASAAGSGPIVVGQPGGAVIAASDPVPTTSPSPSPTATPTAAPTPTATPIPAPDTFSATIHACRRVEGPRCRGEFDEFPHRADSFTALVTFSDARPGDVINARLVGPGVEVAGGPFTLDGGGDGWYYATMRFGELPEGDYALIALRNGVEVARIRLERD